MSSADLYGLFSRFNLAIAWASTCKGLHGLPCPLRCAVPPPTARTHPWQRHSCDYALHLIAKTWRQRGRFALLVNFAPAPPKHRHFIPPCVSHAGRTGEGSSAAAAVDSEDDGASKTAAMPAAVAAVTARAVATAKAEAARAARAVAARALAAAEAAAQEAAAAEAAAQEAAEAACKADVAS